MAITEGTNIADWLAWEQDNRYSREKVTLTGSAIVCGQVLGKVTASGKFAAFNQDGADGTEAAAGVAIADYDASAADVEGVAIVRDAQVVEEKLTFPGDITGPEQIAAMAELKALGIVAKEKA